MHAGETAQTVQTIQAIQAGLDCADFGPGYSDCSGDIMSRQ